MRDLERLLRPKSIVVIGGGFWCENVIRECRKFDFNGNIYAVHPSKQEISGVRVFRSVEELPVVPDAAFIGVNRHLTIEFVRALAAVGAGGAVCFASGFKEASAELDDGSTLQEVLLAAAGDMPILGPNCYGFINALDGIALWPDQHGLQGVDNGVAILTQSSNVALNLTMHKRGLPIAYLATAGNQAQTGLTAIADAFLEDERVSAIGLHIEGLDDLSAFDRFARRARKAGKPVVILKVGRSAQAQSATVSHTASLTGSATGASALFARLGVAEVKSLSTFLETLKLMHSVGTIADNRIVSMSCSGGEASLVADLALERELVFPELSSAQKTKLNELLGDKVALANPLDYHTYIWGDVKAMSGVFATMMAGEASFGVVILDFPRSDRCSTAEWRKVIEAVELAKTASGKPMGILSSLQETMPERIAIELLERGLVPLSGMEEALAAIEAVVFAGKERQTEAVHIPVVPKEETLLGEAQAKALLQRFGLHIPRCARVQSSEGVAAAAECIGFPVVLKGEGFAHKSEAAAVVLGLKTGKEVFDAAAKMQTETFLVEEMISDTVAELLIGVVRDPSHGYVLTLAAGGVLAELFQDSVSMILPVSRTDVESALGQLKLSRFLDGFRGQPSCDRQAIVDAVMSVQAYAISAPVAEVEINPLLCGENFAIAADALIRCEVSKDG